MRKSTKILFIILIVIIVSLVALNTGCEKDFDNSMSTVNLTGARLTWDAIDRADQYFVNIMFSEISGYEIAVEDTTYIVNHSKTGDYQYKVRAKVNGIFTEYSDVFTYHLGDGSFDDPILIGSCEELELISNGLRTVKDVDETDISVPCYYKQTNDIDLEDEEWTPIGLSNNVFKGVYDGAGYNINNLKITQVTGTSTNVAAGLFGLVQDAVIKNVNIIEPDINITNSTSQFSVGALIGRSTTSIVKNCSVVGDITVNAPSVGEKILYAGLVIGESRGTGMSNLYASGNLNATYSRVYAGGIVGITKTSSADIIDNFASRVNVTTHATGRTESGITAVSYAGGIAGYMSYVKSVENCYYSGELTATAIDGALIENINKGMFGGAQNSGSRCNILLEECYFNIDNLGIEHDETDKEPEEIIEMYAEIAQMYTVGNCTKLKSGSTAYGITDEMESIEETYSNFDFENVWEMTDNHPMLRNRVFPIITEMSEVTLEENIITWDAIDGASEYYVYDITNDTELTVYDVNYTILETEVGEYNYKIAAKVIGEKTEYSDIITYIVEAVEE